MKTLLVPTDFSECSANALDAAILFARKTGASILLLHVYPFPPQMPYFYETAEKAHEEELQRAEEKLQSLAGKIRYAGDVRYDTIAVQGDSESLIAEVAAERNASMIIMGTQGERPVSNRIFGSAAAHTARVASCPVLSVPDTFRYDRPIRKIAFATDYYQDDERAIAQSAILATAFDASLVVVHVGDPELRADQAAMDHIIQSVKPLIGDTITFQIIRGEDPAAALSEFATNEAIDLMVVSTTVRHFPSTLFNRSTTRHLVMTARVPVLAYHHDTTNI
jgi:nucleotide-binding universal stress UspA family protein